MITIVKRYFDLLDTMNPIRVKKAAYIGLLSLFAAYLFVLWAKPFIDSETPQWQAIIDNFYLHLVTLITLFAGLVSILIWDFAILRKAEYSSKKEDFGLFWLAVAMYCWGLDSTVRLFLGEAKPDDALHIWHNILSTINSIAFLLAIRHFKYVSTLFETRPFVFLRKIRLDINKDNFYVFISIIFFAYLLFAILHFIPLFLPGKLEWLKKAQGGLKDLRLFIDIFITCFALGYSLYKSFIERRMIGIARLSVVVIVITLLAQIIDSYEKSIFIKRFILIFNNQENSLLQDELHAIGVLFLLLFKVLLIIIFITLALSWIWEQEAEMSVIQRKEMNHSVRGSLTTLFSDILMQIDQKNIDNISYIQGLAYRVKAISALHEKLNGQESAKFIEAQLWFKEIINLVSDSQGTPEGHIVEKIERNLPKLPIRNAQYLGFILFELCINAYKDYAKTAKKLNERFLSVAIHPDDINLYILVVDKATGYNSDDKGIKRGWGTEYLNRIVIEYFNGDWSARKQENGGTKVVVKIPLSNF